MISAATHIARLVRAAYVFAREGVFGVVDPSLVPPPGQLALRLARLIERPGVKSGPRLSRALTRLGPAYLKLGQFLATRPDVVGVAMARDLESLQDRLPPFSQAEAEAVIALSLDRPVANAFVSLGPPVAAASIAQVHRGETERDGVRQSVAVKVLRPNVAARFRRDLADFFFVAHNAEAHSAEARRLRLIEVINTMSRSVAMEMDLRLEAAALSEMAENTRDDPDFRVPAVDWDRTTHNVLTMEWIDGIALNDHVRLAQSHVDLPDLGRKVIQSFLRHALRDGFFHADMHPGNLFLDDAGRLVAVDFGIMGRLGLKERRFLAEILLGFITRDYRRVAEVHFEAGYVPGHHSVENFAQAIRAIGEPIHNRTAEEISMAKLLTLLLEVTGLFDMQTRPELILLQKTMVVVEGRRAGLRSEAGHLESRRTRGARMDRAQSRSARTDSGRGVGRGRTRPRDREPARDRLAGGCRAREHGEDEPRGPDAVAGDDRSDRPGGEPQEPLADGGALDHYGDLYRNSGRHPAVMIAMLS